MSSTANGLTLLMVHLASHRGVTLSLLRRSHCLHKRLAPEPGRRFSGFTFFPALHAVSLW